MYESEIRVRSYELDSFGHVNHAVFLHYFEAARFEALEQAGFDPTELARRGWGIHVVRIEVEYHREVRLGDRLRIRTRTEQLRNSSFILKQELSNRTRDDEVAATARVVVVWVGEDGRPMRIPDEVRRPFAPASDEDPPDPGRNGGSAD